MKRILKEPLLHFLLIGGAIFAVAAWRGRTGGGAPTTPSTVAARPTALPTVSHERATARIEVTAAVIDRLRSGYEQQFGRTPDAQELRGLVTANIREEVFYREALALGLDRDDIIVRRRMAQKMEFLTGDLADVAVPNEASVREFFEREFQRQRARSAESRANNVKRHLNSSF